MTRESVVDTHALAASLLATGRLSSMARAVIADGENDVFVSVASAWEIAIKVGRGKWPEAAFLIRTFEPQIEAAGLIMLPITVEHVRTAGLMAAVHRDPFDGCSRRKRPSKG